MILLSSFLLLLAVNTASGVQPYLVFVDENSETFDFYETDIDLNSSRNFLSFNRSGRQLDNIFVSSEENKKVVFWSYEGTSHVERYDLSTNNRSGVKFEEASSIFIGLGFYEEIYLYFHHQEDLKVYEFDELEPIRRYVHHGAVEWADVDPSFRRQLFYADCYYRKKNVDTYIYNVEQDEYTKSNHLIPEPACLKHWKITPNGKRVYGLQWHQIYVAPFEGGTFQKLHKANNKIKSLAVGNDEVFYTTGHGKLIKLATPMDKEGVLEIVKEISIPKTVTKMALYQPVSWCPA